MAAQQSAACALLLPISGAQEAVASLWQSPQNAREEVAEALHRRDVIGVKHDSNVGH
jgi:hypothetical protein